MLFPGFKDLVKFRDRRIREFVYPVIRWRVGLERFEVGICQMKSNEWVTWFFVWITWFVVFSLIGRQEREVCVKDVSGLNDDLFL